MTDRSLTTHGLDPNRCLHFVHHCLGAVAGDINIEVTIQVVVCDGKAHAALGCHHPGRLRLFSKVQFSVVLKHAQTPIHGVNQQVQIGIPIQIRKGASSRIALRAVQSGCQGDIFKTPLASIAVESIGTIQRGEIKVYQAITIHITRAHA